MFAHWIRARIEQYGFLRAGGYAVFAEMGKKPSGGRPAKEFAITLDMAKELSMVERIDQYGFIEGTDFLTISFKSGGRPSNEYFITLDMAKELVMVKRSGACQRVGRSIDHNI